MGILAHYSDAVTLVNRTIGAGEYERDLNVRYDGEDISLKPGDNPGIPKVVVDFAKRQNILKGSMHPLNPNKFICMVGVKGTKDDVSPLTEEIMRHAEEKYEALDRSGEFWDEPMSPAKLRRSKKTYSAEAARATIGGDFGRPTGAGND